MFGEDALTEWLDFAERDGSHSGSFEPEAEAADSAEKVEDIHRLPSIINKLIALRVTTSGTLVIRL